MIKGNTRSGCLQAGKLFKCRKSVKHKIHTLLNFISKFRTLFLSIKSKIDLLRLYANGNIFLLYVLAYIVQTPAS